VNELGSRIFGEANHARANGSRSNVQGLDARKKSPWRRGEVFFLDITFYRTRPFVSARGIMEK